jgi:hypothetical protein
MAFQSKPVSRTDTKPNNLEIHNKLKFAPMGVLERHGRNQRDFMMHGLSSDLLLVPCCIIARTRFFWRHAGSEVAGPGDRWLARP